MSDLSHRPPSAVTESAASPPDPSPGRTGLSPVPPRRTPTRLLALVAALALLTPSLLSLQAWQAPPTSAEVTDEQLSHGGVLRELQDYRVAPGLDLTTFSRLEEGGWNEGSVLTADLDESTLSVDVADGGSVTGRAPLTDVMRSGENGERAVAAVNGTFFDINHSDAPRYTSVGREGVQMGSPEPMPAVTLAEGQAAVQALSASGTLTLAEDEVHDLAGINNPTLPEDAIGVYTPAWGEYTLDRPVGAPEEPAEQVALATVVDGEVIDVTEVQESAGEPDIPEDGQVLLGREEGAELLADLEVGDEADIAIGPDQEVDLGIAGSHQILTDGEVPDLPDESLVTDIHPRTAVGISRDGSELFVLVLDGRSVESAGMSLPELGQILADMGAHSAVNLDGGGSSALAARAAGAESEAIWNSPSDGEVREVPNALVFYSDAPAEELSDVQTSLALDEEDAVFPGLHRTLDATGLGANLDPVMADGSFAADGALELASSDATGAVVRGTERGSGTVTYAAPPHQASQELRVLGAPIGLQASERSVNLPGTEEGEQLTLSGYDADGQRARLETADVEVDVDGGFEVTDDGLGTWTVTATGETESGSLTLTAADLSTTVALTHGTEEQQVFDFSDLSAFTDESDRAEGSFEEAEGPEGEDGSAVPAVGMTYDFSTSSATRGYYLVADEPVEVEGTALSLTMDVRGDGSGAWPRLQVTDGNGTVTNLDGDHLDFEGWQTVRFTVPDGLAQPLTVERIRMMETRPEAQYTGDIAVADLRAETTPETDVPAEQAVHDPALLTHGSVDERPQRIAVMSDAQFVAADPDSDAVEGARRTLREIQDAAPDLLVINGDFVDEAAPEDFELAQQILDEEWDTDIPYVYVPGNHEVMGGEIANFEDAFGAPTTEQSLGRTQVITLNTASGSLAGGGLEQIEELERQLEAVAESDILTGAVVFFHHPPTDPLPSKLSQLTDQREARAIEAQLAEFRRSSGKSAAVVNGHVGAFHGSAVEGVTYLINGNSGKSPAGTPATGGFTGWTMLGISPGAGAVGESPTTADRVDWLAAETRPWVDEISVQGSEQLPVGGVGEVSASIVQDGLEAPVAWPMTAQWGGAGVQIDAGTGPSAPQGEPGAQDPLAEQDGPGEHADPSAVLRLNPLTGEITGLRPGTATVQVTVNGRSAEQTVTVAGDGPGPDPEDPEEPGDPDDPGEPDEPGDPEAPGEPEEPGDPDDPEKPGEPGDPEEPGKPEEPDAPETPGDSEEPGLPGGSDEPDGPEAPGGPGHGSDGHGSGGGADSAQQGPGQMARTGAETLPLAAGALALIGLGLGALALTRRSRR